MTTPTAAFQARQEWLETGPVDLLYALTVPAPTARTWRLAMRDLDEGALYTASPAYQGLVLSGPVSGSAGLGGSGGAEVTLTLANHLGSYGSGGGPRKRFADWFSEPAAGFGEPYDLHAATLAVSVAIHGLASADVLPYGTFSFLPGSLELVGDVPGQASLLRLTFGRQSKLTRRLPHQRITTTNVVGPTGTNQPNFRGRAFALAFGAALQLPGIAGVTTGAQFFGVCASPVDTPVDLTSLALVMQDPDHPEQNPRAFTLPAVSNPIHSKAPSGAVFMTIRASGGVHNDAATPFILPGAAGTAYVIDSVELDIQHTVGSAITGPAIVSIETDRGGAQETDPNGAPSGILADPVARVSVNVDDIPTDASFVLRTWTFPQKPVLFPGRRYWLVLRYQPTDGDGDATAGFFRWKIGTSVAPDYSMAMFDPGASDPRDWVYAATGGTFAFEINAIAYTLTDTVEVGGVRIAQVDMGAVMEPSITLEVTLNGMKDDGSGTYTGTAAALITNPADAARWLLRHASGLGLASGDVDATSLDTARAALATWPGVREALDTAEPAEVWLARLARVCKSTLYEDQDGKVAMTVRGVVKTPVRHVKPWEHGPLTLRSLAASTPVPLPLSQVELFAQRDPLTLDNPGSSRSRATDWDDFGLISADQTDPADAVRQAQAVVLQARYGVRSNADTPVGPGVDPTVSDLTAGYFVSSAALQTVRADLWDTLSRRPDPFDVLEALFGRYALGWRVGEQITLESWDFPSLAPRESPRTDLWDYPWDDGAFLDVPWYTARRGRYEVREATYQPVGEGWAVRAVLALTGWETP